MEKPIRILQVVTIMNMGGLENFLMNIYRNIDRSKVQFDFLVHREERGVFDDEIEKLGGNIYRLPAIRPTRFFSYLKELKAFFKAHDYQVVHSHLNENSALVLKVAKKLNVPVRIAHSHAKATAGPYRLLREIIKKKITTYSNCNLACSNDAGKWLYNSNNFKVFKNSIDTRRFSYPANEEPITLFKQSLGYTEKDYIIGSVARFSATKNHSFLLDVFYAYLQINQDAKLLLIGEGDLKLSIVKKCKDLGIDAQVRFIGNSRAPENYLNVMNLFLLTSFYEGMPVVLIEAQCNGLPVLMTDTMPQQIELTDLTFRKSLNDSASAWASEIESIRNLHKDHHRPAYHNYIKEAGYDVSDNAEKLVELYLSKIKK